eukprot:sb/3473681/
MIVCVLPNTQYTTLLTENRPSKQPIKTRYLGQVTGYQPIRDQYFLPPPPFLDPIPSPTRVVYLTPLFQNSGSRTRVQSQSKIGRKLKVDEDAYIDEEDEVVQVCTAEKSIVGPRYTGHPDIPGKTLSPEHPGKLGSDLVLSLSLLGF